MSSQMLPVMMKRAQLVDHEQNVLLILVDEDAVGKVAGRKVTMVRILLMDQDLTAKKGALNGRPLTQFRRYQKMLVRKEMGQLLLLFHLTWKTHPQRLLNVAVGVDRGQHWISWTVQVIPFLPFLGIHLRTGSRMNREEL